VCVSFSTLEIDYLRQDGIFARAKVDFAARALFLSCFFLYISFFRRFFSSLLYFYSQSTNTERQRPISGVHSIMMEKLAQAGVGGGLHAPLPILFLYIYHHVQRCGVRSN
jgi:hypothetical protein